MWTPRGISAGFYERCAVTDRARSRIRLWRERRVIQGVPVNHVNLEVDGVDQHTLRREISMSEACGFETPDQLIEFLASQQADEPRKLVSSIHDGCCEVGPGRRADLRHE